MAYTPSIVGILATARWPKHANATADPRRRQLVSPMVQEDRGQALLIATVASFVSLAIWPLTGLTAGSPPLDPREPESLYLTSQWNTGIVHWNV